MCVCERLLDSYYVRVRVHMHNSHGRWEQYLCQWERERERKVIYPVVCSHGYYHDVGQAGLLSPWRASLSHSIKVGLADESLHSMLLVQTHQPTHQPVKQSVIQSDRDRDVSHCISTLGGSGLCGWGLHVLIVSDCSQTLFQPSMSHQRLAVYDVIWWPLAPTHRLSYKHMGCSLNFSRPRRLWLK